MQNFDIFNPVHLHFGKDVTNEIGDTCSVYGRKALLVYGKGSVVKHGYLDIVKKQLHHSGIETIEYSGIKSNPVTNDVDEATQLGLKHNIDVIVAIGGGSVIDSSKILSLCIPGNYKSWDVMKGKVEPKEAVPLLCVLTLAATGTEMNPVAVLQDTESREKIGFNNKLIYPKHSFLDPQFTFSVPNNYTAYGIVDLIAHSLENFFGLGEAGLTDRIVYSIIKEAMKYAPLVLEEPHNYDYRANIMWAATLALNGTTQFGKTYGDWGVHGIGHILSFLYDTPHGASLSIAYPAWMKIHLNKLGEKISDLGRHLFDIDKPEVCIHYLENFFRSVSSPVRLSEIHIGKEKSNEIIDLMKENKVSGLVHHLDEQDYKELVNLML